MTTMCDLPRSFEGLAAGSRPRAFAIQEMLLELQQADRAVAGREGRDSLLVECC
jgi:hypothetical protein